MVNFFENETEKKNKNFSRKMLFSPSPFFFITQSTGVVYLRGCEPPEPDRLPPREKERFDDFLMFGVELSDPILLSMEGQAFRASPVDGANRAAKVLLTG